MLTWRDEYSVGVEPIDNQHKILFNIGNKAINAIKEDTSLNGYDDITTILNELKEYTIFHFNFEEEYMLHIKYEMYLIHKKEHDKFIEKLNELTAKNIDNTNILHLQDVLKFIVEWICNHILKTDMLYK